MTGEALLHAYRHLYRNALRATHRSSPAKHVIRETIRTAFRTEPACNFSLRRVKNTEDFLKRAEKDTGVEHRILKNLLHVRYWQHHGKRDNRLYVETKTLPRGKLMISSEYASKMPCLPRSAKKTGLNMMQH